MENSYCTHEIISLVKWAIDAPEWRTDDTMYKIVRTIEDMSDTLARMQRRAIEKDAEIMELRDKLAYFLDHFTRSPMELNK
jgi:hypothetical protein